jgi:hypothetical protein
MHLSFEPTGFDTKLILPREGESPREDYGTLSGPPVLVWQVRPARGERTRLATGGELRDVDGRIRLLMDPPPYDEKNARGSFGWHEDRGYQVTLHLSRDAFVAVLENVRARAIPSLSLFVPEGGGLKMGWEPDGSGKEWDNRAHPSLDIGWWRFEIALSPSEDATEEKPAAAPVTHGQVALLHRTVVSLTTAAWVVAAAAVAVLVLRLR